MPGEGTTHRSCVIAVIVNVDTLMDQTKTLRVVEEHVEPSHDLVVIVSTKDSSYLRHWPGECGIVVRGSARVISTAQGYEAHPMPLNPSPSA